MFLHSAARSRILELDGLRGLAILAVLLCHFGIISCPSRAVAEILGFGWVGVDLFFALSGFLITDILLASVNHEDYFRRFYARRVFRIFPAYYLFLFCFFHLGPLVARLPGLHSLTRGRGEEWWYWSYLYNWSPFSVRNRSLAHVWSLCVEEQFYLVWPVVVRYTPRRFLKWLCVGVAFVSPLVRLGSAVWGVSPVRIYGETIFRLDGLAIGALLAIALRDSRLARWIAIWSKPLLAAAAVLMLAILCRDGVYYQGRAMLVWGGSALAVLSAAAVFYCRQIGAPLRSPFLRSFGRYSYGMYIWHYPVAERARIELLKLDGNLDPFRRWTVFGVVIAGGVAAAWVIGWLSWRLIEAPSMHVRDRLMRHPRPQRHAPRWAEGLSAGTEHFLAPQTEVPDHYFELPIDALMYDRAERLFKSRRRGRSRM